ncbi:ATP-binding protein [Nitrincola tapanii]|uniref:histidine kinase n=1 Tax=Nitrincola tapanii TaxID=1708751 RepID=A0A5A9W0R9_9GAMM|nr:ATP-binding protein [Nitrincola tapanii]KAA0874370.1 HAMP domain-containing protein [Nitrincola tapanii]
MMLQRAHLQSLIASERSQAQLQVYLLLGAAEIQQGQPMLPAFLQEPGFAQPESGVYGVISDREGDWLWRSESAALLPESWRSTLQQNLLEPGQSRFLYLRDRGMFLLQYPVIWESEGQDYYLRFSVLRSDERVEAQLLAFKTQLWAWLGGIFVLALLVQYLILRWGLRPLYRLARDLNRIEKGQAEELSGRYPLELQQVTDSLNQLIRSERQQRERYRNTLGDLAHSLKTPLAVMSGAVNESLSFEAYQQRVEEQVQRMNQIVQYQLSRAVKAEGRVLAKPIPIAPVVQRLMAVLQKVYAEKEILGENQVLATTEFFGDERDLLELLGNLLENAFKYGRHQVRVSSIQTRNGSLLIIEDDGNGIMPEQSRVILERGKRMDTSTTGQGIGLAVTVDILSSYGGGLEADNSPELGGARFRLMLPKP